MNIGHLKIDNPIFHAPMSGITNYTFRKVSQSQGCGLLFTEMISADGLLRKGKNMLKIQEDEHPIVVQLFGQEAEILADAAEMAEDFGADGVDLNMGCPADHIVRTGAGANLMRHPEKVKKILKKIKA